MNDGLRLKRESERDAQNVLGWGSVDSTTEATE